VTIRQAAKRIYRDWGDAPGKNDVNAASPLVRHLFGTDDGIVAGRVPLRAFLDKVFRHQPKLRQRYRDGFFIDGAKSDEGVSASHAARRAKDFVEVTELKDGFIHRHRVYRWWRSLKTWHGRSDR
jgi:hypothetical protein